jgi:hypothetical protein
MNNKKHYQIRLTQGGNTYWLRKGGKVFHWCNHGKDQRYQTLSAANRKAARIRVNPSIGLEDKVEVVEVAFKPCNLLLPDGFYEPVFSVVG